MNHLKRLQTIIDEYKYALEAIDNESIELLAAKITKARRVFLAATGRTRCVTEMFAMRLAQAEITAYMVGEVTTPAIAEDDLLICASGSGETTGLMTLIQKAKTFNPIIFGITATPRSTLTKLSDYALLLPSPEHNTQILGNYNETCLLFILDQVIESILCSTNKPVSDLRANHANIE